MKLIDGTKYFYILALKEINNVMSELKKLEVADDHEKTRLKRVFDLGFGRTIQELIVLRKT